MPVKRYLQKQAEMLRALEDDYYRQGRDQTLLALDELKRLHPEISLTEICGVMRLIFGCSFQPTQIPQRVKDARASRQTRKPYAIAGALDRAAALPA